MPLQPEARRSKLVEALRCRTPVMQRRLTALKQEAKELRRRTDLVWYLLLECASTMGNVRGWVTLSGDKALLKAVSYAELKRLTPSRRRARLLSTMKEAHVRMPPLKAKWLAANFDEVERLGGVRRATRDALALKGREAKLAFARRFDGIGPKYANNFWMDLYDRDFRDCVAVDERLKKISKELGLDGSSDYQDFFCALARDADMTPWDLDRLLFWFTDYFIAAIRW